MSDPDLHTHLSRPAAGTIVLEVSGEIDLCSSPSLEEGLLQAIADGAGRLVIDLSKTSYMDSSGLSCLAAARNRAQETGCAMALVAPDGQVRRVLAISAMDSVIQVYDSLEEAIGTRSESD